MFSDSAFLRTDSAKDAIEIARSLMFELVTLEVPVRMGIAKGPYRMLRTASDQLIVRPPARNHGSHKREMKARIKFLIRAVT